MEALSNKLYQELKQTVRASDRDCWATTQRLSDEVERICEQSQRIQESGEVDTWAHNLGMHRLNQCLKYYRLGSFKGRVELHSTLSAIVYRYISPPHTQATYQARLNLIEDFLQNFYLEALNAFRRENNTAIDYQPRTLLQLAEYMAFTERYGKRRIPLPGRRSQQLIILRAQTFAKQQPPEATVDIDKATDGGGGDADETREALPTKRLRDALVAQQEDLPEEVLRNRVIEALLNYLKERNQEDCADYFTLRLLDLPTPEIEAILNLTPRQRDYLQQRFKYHLVRFSLSHHWDIVHEWLEADLERNLGLAPQQWHELLSGIDATQAKLLQFKQDGLDDVSIAKRLGITSTQLQKQWTKLLEQAWEIRNL
ncbi:MAG: heterocyst differentiation protein HetZ [Leptolyngbyaceae cyanobacterium]